MKQSEIEKIKPIFEAHNVVFAGLFGSRARGEQRADSDLDMMIKFARPVGFFDFVDLQDRLSEVVGYKVDLVTENSLSPYIRQAVLEQLVPIYGQR